MPGLSLWALARGSRRAKQQGGENGGSRTSPEAPAPNRGAWMRRSQFEPPLPAQNNKPSSLVSTNLKASIAISSDLGISGIR